MAGVNDFRNRFSATRPEPEPPPEAKPAFGPLGTAITEALSPSSAFSAEPSFTSRGVPSTGMEILNRVYLENTLADHRKFWTAQVEKTTEGGYVLRRRWGRIGTRGQEKVEGFGSRRSDAMSNFYALRESKLKDGYVTKELGTR